MTCQFLHLEYIVNEENDHPIWMCGGYFKLQTCPLTWEALEKTGVLDKRYCHVCERDVYRCETPEQLVRMTQANECVAIPVAVDVPPGIGVTRHILGTPKFTMNDLDLAGAAKEWWATVCRISPEQGRTQFLYRWQILPRRHRLLQLRDNPKAPFTD